MTSVKSLKIYACVILIIQVLSMNHILAQSKGDIVFENYNNLNNDILRVLKKNGDISRFRSMSKLKELASDLKENTSVRLNYVKGSDKLKDPIEMIRERKESVPFVCLFVPAQNNQSEKVVTFATAIILSEDGLCTTNYHVLSGLINKGVKLNPNDSLMFLATSKGKVYPIESIKSYNRAADLALFKINTNGEKLKAIPVGEDLPAGATVHSLTHPDGYPFFYSKGVVSRNLSLRSGDPYSNRMEISADYAVGSSGGPIMDDRGNLVGMVSTTRSIYAIPNIQRDLQMVVKSTIPISSILKLTFQ